MHEVLQRSATVSYATKGEWIVAFLRANTDKMVFRYTTNYHDLGPWISNWILSDILPE